MTDKDSYMEYMKKHKNKNITTKVNDKCGISYMNKKYKHITKTEKNQKYLENYIKNNLLEFLSDGTYIKYFLK